VPVFPGSLPNLSFVDVSTCDRSRDNTLTQPCTSHIPRYWLAFVLHGIVRSKDQPNAQLQRITQDSAFCISFSAISAVYGLDLTPQALYKLKQASSIAFPLPIFSVTVDL
jgi:hypothetical protein